MRREKLDRLRAAGIDPFPVCVPRTHSLAEVRAEYLDRLGADSLAAGKSDVDLGYHVFGSGAVITSRRGELSVLPDSWRLTSKSPRPLPVAHKPDGRRGAGPAAGMSTSSCGRTPAAWSRRGTR